MRKGREVSVCNKRTVPNTWQSSTNMKCFQLYQSWRKGFGRNWTLDTATTHTECSRSFSIVIRFAGFCSGRFVAMRYKFNLVTYVQRPLVIDRRGGTERNLNEITAGN